MRRATAAFLVLIVVSLTTTSAALAQALRTPESRFAGLTGYTFAPRYREVPWGTATVRMHYLDEGPKGAPPVLLLHGQPSWSFMYRNVIRSLVARGHRVIAPNMIGYGRSDKPTRMEDYSYDRHLVSLQSLVEGLDLRQASLVVHDWGGLLGLPMLQAMPDRFSRVALFNTSLNDGTDAETPHFKVGFDRWKEHLRTAPIIRIDRVIAAQTATQLSADVRAAYMAPFPDGRFQSGVRRMSALVPRSPDDIRARENGRVRQWLENWRKPVLIAFSADSERLHPGQFALFNRLFRSDIVWASRRIANTKHFLFEDRPEEIAELLHAFVSGAAPSASTPPSPAPVTSDSLSGARLQSDVSTYVSFGEQRTGSSASKRTLDWLQGRLAAAGYRVSRMPIEATTYDLQGTRLQIGGEAISDGFPLWPIRPTAKPITGPLLHEGDTRPGGIRMARLPFSPLASVFDPRYRTLLARLRAFAPVGAVLVTEHPTGEVVALNVAEGRGEPLPFPVLLVGQKHAERLEAVVQQASLVTMSISATTGRGADASLIAERGDASSPALVISTPKNGWFRAGGERGPGVALALALAEWIAVAHPDMAVRLAFTSHHELGGGGIRAVLADQRFAPDRVHAWVHLGANIATVAKAQRPNGTARLWPEASHRRGVSASGSLLALARQHLQHIPDMKVNDLAYGGVGEVSLIARGRTHPVAGFVGYQPLHHTRMDDAGSTSPQVLEPIAHGLAAMIGNLR